MATRGARRHLVTLKNPGAPIPDGIGGFSYTWTTLDPAQMYAAIVVGAPRNLERDPANTVLATTTYLVILDYHPGVTTETRIAWEHGEFAVTGIRNPDLRGIELELTCEDVIV